jgi:hypothetical protein
MLSVRLLLVLKLEVIFISLVLQMALPHFICLFGDIRRFMKGTTFFHVLQKVGCEKDCPYWKQSGSKLLVGF